MRRCALVTLAVGLVAVACSAPPGSVSSTTTAGGPGGPIDGAPIFVTAIEEAVAVGMAAGARHSWPQMTVDEWGAIHLIWETRGPEGGLSYAWSGDGGETFSEPRLIVDRELSDGGSPASPSASHHDGHVVVTWAGGRQGYVAAWSTGD